ncbi:zinc finger protein 292a [Pimephales promelas]|nr:zinc finger protein 292a [Pimephales promelas]
MNEVSQEFTPVERKHTVESIIDNVQDSTEQPEHLVPCTAQLTVSKNYSLTTNAVQPDESKTPHCFESTKQLHLESCFVKLEPIPIKCNDPKYLDALKNADSETQTLLKDKKLFSFTLRQLKLSTLKSSLSVKKANKEEGLTHVCPFETCTRKYSTSKSLSRHVKNVHSEAFEEWKLSKKYKRIAEIAAKKSAESTTTSSQIAKWTSRSRQTEHTTFLDSVLESTSSIFSNHDSMQSISAKFCSQLENPQSAALPNQTDLMQFPITQTWAAPPMENLDSGFSVLPYSSTILSDNQHTNPSYHSDTVLDYASPSSYDDINPLSVNANTPSSVMNEASKYVSSSLRVLHAFNSEQTCDLSQVESSVNPGFSQIGQNHPGDISICPLSGQNCSLYFSTLPSEAGPISVQPLENSIKEISTDSTDALLSSDVKTVSNLLTPHFKESSDDFFSVAPLTDPSLAEENHVSELNKPGIFVMQELSDGRHLFDTTDAPDERTENTTSESNRQIEMNSDVMVDIQEKTTMTIDTIDSGDSRLCISQNVMKRTVLKKLMELSKCRNTDAKSNNVQK